MGLLVVYTAIVGPRRDVLHGISGWPESVPLVAFVDPFQPHVSPWKQVPALCPHLSPQRRARWHKLHPHLLFPESTETIWLDGSITPHPTMLEELRRQPGDLLVFRHPWRDCAYEEAQFCAEQMLDDPRLIEVQLERYARMGFPRKWGLAETGFLRRRGDWQDWNEAWWREVEAGSLRDQISFPFVCWSTGRHPCYIEANIRHSPWWRWRKHVPRRYPGSSRPS